MPVSLCSVTSDLFLQILALFSSQKLPEIYFQVTDGILLIGVPESYFEFILTGGKENVSCIKIPTENLFKYKGFKKKDLNKLILLNVEENSLEILFSDTIFFVESGELCEDIVFGLKTSGCFTPFNIGNTDGFLRNFCTPTSSLKTDRVSIVQKHLYWITDTLVARVPFCYEKNLTFSFDVTGLSTSFLKLFSTCYLTLSEEEIFLVIESNDDYKYIRSFKNLNGFEKFSEELIEKLVEGFSNSLTIGNVPEFLAVCKQAKTFTDRTYSLVELTFVPRELGVLSFGNTDDSCTPEFNFAFGFNGESQPIGICLNLTSFLKILEIFKKSEGITLSTSEGKVKFTGCTNYFLEVFVIPYQVLEE